MSNASNTSFIKNFEAEPVAHSEKRFDRTLIIGASVSAAVTDRNPAKRFLRSQGRLQGVLLHAQGGTPGARVLASFKKSLLDTATAVIGVDLLFWDSVMGLGDPHESTAFLRGFRKEVERRRLPLIIGRIPGFHALQVHRDELNDQIERECSRYELARVLPLDRLFDQVMSDSGVRIDGRLHTLNDLIPDGLHPGPVAAEFIAQEIAKLALTLTSELRAAASS